MKKLISFMLVLVMGLSCVTLTSCSSEETSDKNLKIVTTIFPVYDWTNQILGDKAGEVDVTMLLDSGVDLHSYQPSSKDLLKISDCDVFIYVGGESDEWVEDALGDANNADVRVINLMDVLGDNAKEEEVVEGMESEDEHDEDVESSQDKEEKEYDEHIWLSLKNAMRLAPAIADEIAAADAGNAELYKVNADSYVSKISELDKDYADAVSAARVKTLIFGDRFPFRYMADDYNLDYYAAFSGCSAETEASFETIVFLADKADKLGVKSIIALDNSDQKIAKTIIENTKDKNQQVLTLNSMQSTTSEDVQNGTSYLDIMKTNLDTIKEALK